jgi:thiamine biosynthesis lipoprotein
MNYPHRENLQRALVIVLVVAANFVLIGCRLDLRLGPASASASLGGTKAKQAPKPEDHLSRFEYQHGAMGTLFTLTFYAQDEATAGKAAEAAFARVDALEEILSDYQADSELSMLKGRPVGTPVKVSQDLWNVLARSREITEWTGGAFDVTAGPYTRLWRFARKRKVLPSNAEIAEARRAVGMEKLRLDAKNHAVTMTVPGMRLDVGGIAKGYAADEVMELLKRQGITRVLIAASGDIRAGEPPPGKEGWTVAVAGIGTSGDAAEQQEARVLLKNSAISTSGDTEQFIEINGVRYSHILSPATGLGLTNTIQASVIAPNATLSDALATSLCILGPERGLKLLASLREKPEALVIEKKNGTKVKVRSKGFNERIVRGTE